MNRISILLLIGFGGFLGSIARYLSAQLFENFNLFSSSFPYGTFFVNILGSFLIGVFYGLSKTFTWFDSSWSLFLVTGFAGGFTTFSAFSYENLTLFQNGDYFSFFGYSILSFTLGMAAVFIGLWLVEVL